VIGERDGLIDRYVELKGDLVGYATAGPFRDDWAASVAPDGVVGDDETIMLYTDMFITSGDKLRGRTLIEHFIAVQPDLSDEDRSLLRSWDGGAVTQVYELQGREGAAVRLRGVIDELEYTAEVTMGSAIARRIAKAKYLFARLLPVGQLWVVSGSQLQFSARQEREALELAAEWAFKLPEVIWRNPDLLSKGWELQRHDRELFCEFFGSDVALFPVDEARTRIGEYWQWRFRQGRDGADDAAPEPFFSFDADDLVGVETVGMVYDEVEGISFVKDYDRLLDVFDDPRLVRRRMGKMIVTDYLKGEELGPAPRRRAAQADPAKSDRVFALLLGRKSFSWERDSEALLRRYKPSWFETEPRPKQIPFSDRLTEAFRRRRR
jgi:hypothetical protein